MENNTVFIYYVIVFWVWLISGILSYVFIRAAHKEGGIWEVINPKISDIIVVISPVLNTLFLLFMIVYLWNPKKHTNTKIPNKFFKIK